MNSKSGSFYDEDIATLVGDEDDDTGLSWYMARCPDCGVEFNMLENKGGENLVCPNGHEL